MKIKLYHVDAFTSKIFGGNPAAVCPLNTFLPDDVLQNIAMENNLSETSFFVKENDKFHIRWFTPIVEVNLCGHGTLATAFVIFNYENFAGNTIRFHSKSGELSVKKEKEILTLDFPADKLERISPPEKITNALGAIPIEAYKGKTDYLFVYNTQEQVYRLYPDFRKLSEVNVRGIIATAKGNDCDFISRFFAPVSGVEEDPVTGSAHTSLTVYWSAQLGKTSLSAIQLSKRKGYLHCKMLGDRVEISGEARLYLTGEIEISG
ncbi:MAG: PhzF family phenazine biosynthesis protein [Bacteroidota bacterium]